jgi:hypothetical protein
MNNVSKRNELLIKLNKWVTDTDDIDQKQSRRNARIAQHFNARRLEVECNRQSLQKFYRPSS